MELALAWIGVLQQPVGLQHSGDGIARYLNVFTFENPVPAQIDRLLAEQHLSHFVEYPPRYRAKAFL